MHKSLGSLFRKGHFSLGAGDEIRNGGGRSAIGQIGQLTPVALPLFVVKISVVKTARGSGLSCARGFEHRFRIGGARKFLR
jgi:hypothetical protein